MLLPACAGARRWGATPDTTAVYARFADNLEDVDPAFVDEHIQTCIRLFFRED